MTWQAKEIAPVIVSTVVIGGFIIVCSLLFTKIIPAESKDIAQIMFGGLVAMATTVVNYWMGSSSGSQRKDETIADLRGSNRDRDRDRDRDKDRDDRDRDRDRDRDNQLGNAGNAVVADQYGKIIVTDTTMSNTVTSNTTTSTHVDKTDPQDKNNLLGGR